MPMIMVNRIRYFNRVMYKYLVGRQGYTMDSSIFTKHFDQEMLGVEVMMGQFEEWGKSLNKEKYEYIVWRLKSRLHLVYEQFLVKAYDNKQMDFGKLIEFDNKMKLSYPSSYDLTESMHISKRLPYKYIKAFRRFHSRRYPSIIATVFIHL